MRLRNNLKPSVNLSDRWNQIYTGPLLVIPSYGVKPMTTDQKTMESVLDLATAMTNMDGDVELLQEIMEIFLETADEQLQSIENCILIGDTGQVATQAHGMKGGASNFCASKFVASALKLEQLAKSGTLDGAQELLDRMRADFQEVREVAQVINWEEVARNWTE